MKVLILGVNGFIGHSLAKRILDETDWEVAGMDLESDRLQELLDHPRMRFLEGDIAIHREWIEYHVKRSDVVLPLVAIATPATYVTNPLGVFELDFEENLRIIRYAARYDTRVVFPSTSEVYGLCHDDAFDEFQSELVLGPIDKQRWIYSCAKQLLDRIIWASGEQQGLRFTLFRPFNWIGPGLDDIDAAKEGSSRVMTQFLGHLLRREPLRLVAGGHQRRSFTFIDDGTDALMKILANEGGVADRQIFNLGHPGNDCSIRELAEHMRAIVAEYPGYEDVLEASQIEVVSEADYYGKGYQDMPRRVPNVQNARERLGWQPRVDLDQALRRTIAHYVQGAPRVTQVRRVGARAAV
ncbi:MAG: bifunctional UDP-4-keto-pentose/UDP-xylose synthase [Planctomycetota bacterium]